MSYLRGSVLTLAVCLLSLGALAGARAQSASDKAAAEALFDRGLALMKEGKYQEACEKLEQSQAVERGIGTMLYLAECYEKVGKTASAWALFREASSVAQAGGQLERAEAGRRRAEKLEKGLSRLTIHVARENRLPGMVVQDNGFSLQQAVWSVAVPVDPGNHRVEVSAPGYLSWTGDVKVEGHGASAELHVPALAKDPNAAAVAAAPVADTSASPAGAEPATATAASQAATAPPRMSNLRITGIALGAAGIVGIAVGAALGGVAMGNKNEVKDAQSDNGGVCPNSACVNKLEDAKSQANASTALWAVGGALLAGGLVTFLIAPKYQEEKRPQVALYADPRGAGMSVGGVF